MLGEGIRISCDDCALQGSDACGDCVVTFLLRDEADSTVVIEPGEVHAMRLFQDAGLVPLLRHERRAG